MTLEDVLRVRNCPRCLEENRGPYPLSPTVSHCRRCGWNPEEYLDRLTPISAEAIRYGQELAKESNLKSK